MKPIECGRKEIMKMRSDSKETGKKSHNRENKRTKLSSLKKNLKIGNNCV